jgi:death on curing protein
VTSYPTLLEVLAIHDRLLVEFGGASGIRDPGGLESALFRPQTGYYDDVVAEAAALLESLIVAGTDDAYDAVVGALEAGGDRFVRLETWLRTHLE